MYCCTPPGRGVSKVKVESKIVEGYVGYIYLSLMGAKNILEMLIWIGKGSFSYMCSLP